MGKSLIPCLFFGLILFVAASDLVVWLMAIELPGRRFVRTPVKLSWSDLRYSTWGPKIENHFTGRSVLYHGSGALYNEMFYRMARRTTGLVAANEGWLFLKSNTLELEAEDLDASLAEGVEVMAAVHERLAERGKKLWVVLIPNRPVIYAELAGNPAVGGRGRYLDDFCAALEQRGVRYVNLTEPLQRLAESGVDTHFRADHHWSYEGCQASAQAVATTLLAEPHDRWVSAPRGGGVSWEVADPPVHRSLVSFLKFRKESELERRYLRGQSLAVFEDDWKAMAPDGEVRDILTLESSFGMFGFAQFLESALGTGVDALVEPGNGSVYPLARYLSGGYGGLIDREHRWVIWVVPQYHLEEGLKNEGGSRIRLPDSRASSAASREVAVLSQQIRGGTPHRRRFHLKGRQLDVRLEFGEPVELVKFTCNAGGGMKRGILTCRGAGEEGLLVHVGGRETDDYWFRLEPPRSRVDLSVVFPDFGYWLRDLTWQGFSTRE